MFRRPTIEKGSDLMELLNRIAAGLQEGDDVRVAELTRQAVAEKIPARQVLDEGLIAGMNVVGRLFRDHEIFLPDVLLAARAMYAGLDVLKPLLVSENVPTAGKVVIGTVQGDLHDIGKNLVGIMLRGAGFDVIDLGNDVAPERFVETATRENAQVIGMSALLTTTMTGMQRVMELLDTKGQRGRIKTIIGGAPVTAEYAREIGADAFGFDAASAVERVKELAAR
jgi:5-methyltetrahydrofolate--homocysteine methyltransferase